MRDRQNRKSSSLQFKSMVILGSVYLPLIILLIFSLFYSVDALKKKSYEMETQMVRYYIQNLDGRLETLEDYIRSYTTTNTAIQAMAFQNVYPQKYELYKYQAYQELVNAVSAHGAIDYMYIYDSRQEKCYIAGKSEKDYNTRTDLAESLKILFESGIKIPSTWQCFEGEKAYLIRNIKYGDVQIGILLKAENCLNISNYFTKDSNVLMCNEEGRCIDSLHPMETESLELRELKHDEWILIDNIRYLQVHTESQMGDFYLVGIIPKTAVYENLPKVYFVSGCLILTGILLIPICVILIRKEILKPISGLTTAISLITEGDMDIRALEEKNMAKELQIIYESFNDMMDQIQLLQEEILEKQKREQRMKLLQLQYQIRPHFFLNSLNGIYSLAETGQDAVIQKMVLSLSNYFRYIFGADKNFVKIAEECRYVYSYADIRKILQKEMLTVQIDADRDLDDVKLPPFTIMTLVENAYKHGAIAGRALHIWVSIEKSRDEGYMEIQVEDNGKGFSEGILEQLKEHKPLLDENGEHTGIYNVCERLRISYERQVFVSFENRESKGAVIKLKIPIEAGGERDVSDLTGR